MDELSLMNRKIVVVREFDYAGEFVDERRYVIPLDHSITVDEEEVVTYIESK